MAAKKGESLNKESDSLQAIGIAAVNKAEKIKLALNVEMTKPGMKEKVMNFLFSKDTDAVSPLEFLRD